ncbi:hypothetical protein [Candidatus Symbiobacter mobilis]|uniref:Uncharacterized protein n=1 Tax=Candidatus Symbiobacter mobilis CR TaxID=946483 RepID=U5N6C2_9BURK|nr:hypothetical protein [Candidatus Symbiobacter mobilis]AGX86907.1 hypothetical protein Cenrod_0801 [Candidatus Symbiobacter mobilis CR]
MPKKSILHTLLATSVLVSGSNAIASEGLEILEFKGFGTVAATRTDSADNGYKATPQPASLARGNSWSLQNDSLIGVQLDIAPHNDLSGTVQVIGRNREQGDFEADFEWAFIKYKIDNNWRVRVGRVLTPAFMDSEYRFVGYANIYARPDPNIYTVYPLSTHDGLDVTYRRNLDAGGTLTASFYGGKAELEGPGNIIFEASRLTGFSLRYEKDNFMVRVSNTQTNMIMSGSGAAMFPPFLAAAQTAVTQGCTSCINAVNAIRNGIEDTGLGISNIGFRYSFDDYTAWGEYIKVHQNEILNPVDESYLLGLSKSIEKWTPYITYSDNKTTSNASKIDLSDIMKITIPPIKGAMLAYNSPAIFSKNNGRHTFALGTRYDIAKNTAIFIEWAEISLDDNVDSSPLPYPRLSPQGQPRDGKFHLYTLSLSFVF